MAPGGTRGDELSRTLRRIPATAAREQAPTAAGYAGQRHRAPRASPQVAMGMPVVVTGLLNKQIAAQLRTREATVKAHRAQLMRKMEADSIAQLVRIAEGLSLLPPRR
jgi:FixJ family two-component response regulator